MSLIFKVINNPIEAFNKVRNSKLSWMLVIITVTIITILDSVLGCYINEFEFNVSSIIINFVVGIGSYILISIILGGICIVLGGNIKIRDYISCWGITFAPNILVAITTVLAENLFYIFWGRPILAMVINILLVGALIWKIILYAIFLKEIGELERKSLKTAFVLGVFVVIIVAVIDILLGLKIPII